MEFLTGFFGGLARILAGLLNWQFKEKEPFEWDKFFTALISAALTGGVFQFTMDVNFGAQEILLGWGTASAINKALSITGIGRWLSTVTENAVSVFREQ